MKNISFFLITFQKFTNTKKKLRKMKQKQKAVFPFIQRKKFHVKQKKIHSINKEFFIQQKFVDFVFRWYIFQFFKKKFLIILTISAHFFFSTDGGIRRIFWILKITDGWIVILKKDCLRIFISFVELSFSIFDICRRRRIRENIKFNYSPFSSLETRDKWTVILRKICFMQVIREKLISFGRKYFDQLEIEKIWKPIERPYVHCNRERSRYWCWENSIDFCCIFQTRDKSIFSVKNFSTNNNSKKYESRFRDLLLIGIERGVDTDAEKIRFTFVVYSKRVTNRFFLLKIFPPIRIRENLKVDFATFYSLESREEWIQMLRKFYWVLFYIPNAWQIAFFFKKFFDQSEFWENMKVHLATIFSLESRQESILMLRKFHWSFLYTLNGWKTDFFHSKILRPIRIRENMKVDFATFCSLQSREESILMLRKFDWVLLCIPNAWQIDFFF